MGSATLPFVVLPCIGAVIAAFLVSDWRLAAAVVAGGMALVILLIAAPLPFAVFVLPVVSGAALGALALIPVLVCDHDASVWTRMTVSLAVVFAASFANLLLTAGRI